MSYSPIKDGDGNDGGNGGASSGGDNGVVSRIGNVLGGIGDKIKGCLPDTSNLYLQPLSPSADISLSDRWRLIVESTRPWGEFFDISNFNLPAWNHMKTRIGHNIETFFYNYFWLTCLHLIVLVFFHFGSVLSLVLWLVFIFYLYGVKRDDIHIGSLTINNTGKLLIMIATAILALTFGHVSTLVISVAIFLAIVVGIHGLVRDDSSDTLQDVTI